MIHNITELYDILVNYKMTSGVFAKRVSKYSFKISTPTNITGALNDDHLFRIYNYGVLVKIIHISEDLYNDINRVKYKHHLVLSDIQKVMLQVRNDKLGRI